MFCAVLVPFKQTHRHRDTHAHRHRDTHAHTHAHSAVPWFHHGVSSRCKFHRRRNKTNPTQLAFAVLRAQGERSPKNLLHQGAKTLASTPEQARRAPACCCFQNGVADLGVRGAGRPAGTGHGRGRCVAIARVVACLGVWVGREPVCVRVGGWVYRTIPYLGVSLQELRARARACSAHCMCRPTCVVKRRVHATIRAQQPARNATACIHLGCCVAILCCRSVGLLAETATLGCCYGLGLGLGLVSVVDAFWRACACCWTLSNPRRLVLFAHFALSVALSVAATPCTHEQAAATEGSRT